MRQTAAEARAAPHSCSAIWSASIVERNPAVGCMRTGVASFSASGAPAMSREQGDKIVGNEKARSGPLPLRRLEVFPARRARSSARVFSPASRSTAARLGLSRTILAHEAEALRQRRVEPRETGFRRVSEALVADHEAASSSGTEQEQRLFEARLEAREEGHVGVMLAVGIDDKPIRSGSRIGLVAARRVSRGGNPRRLERNAEIGNDDVAQRYRHEKISSVISPSVSRILAIASTMSINRGASDRTAIRTRARRTLRSSAAALCAGCHAS